MFQEKIKLPVCSTPYYSPNHGGLDLLKSGGDILCTLKLTQPMCAGPRTRFPIIVHVTGDTRTTSLASRRVQYVVGLTITNITKIIQEMVYY